MDSFWRFARRMLRYRGLLTTGMVAAVVDALCAFGGFGALMWIISQLFGSGQTVRGILTEKLSIPWVHAIVGDPTVITQYVPASNFGGFAFILGVILVLSLIGSSMRITHQWCTIIVGLRTTMGIRKDAFQSLISSPMETMLAHGSADYLSRVVRDSNTLTSGFTAITAKAVRDILMGMVWLALALLINWKLTILFIIGLPLVYVAIRKFGKRIRKATQYALEAFGLMTGAIQEALGGMAVVKVHTAEGYERRRFNKINRKVLNEELRARMAQAMSSPVIELIAIIGVMIVALVAAYVVYKTSSGQPQQMVKVLIALAMTGVSLRPLANLNNSVQSAAAAAQRLEQILELPTEPGPRDPGHEKLTVLPRHDQSISFENVSYAYPGTTHRAIENINLTAEHEQTIAIVGPNGSGKSTLLNLLPRLTEPSEGRVVIDGVNVADATLRSLRKQIAMVTQQTVLFEGSIADNIAYGQFDVTQEKIITAAKSAHAHEFIIDLEKGYDTRLGEGGVGLSGGQKQRLCIARAILRDPAILILDEATSQIDADSEAKINQALSELRVGRTTFIIAHRLSTVVDADLIVVMRDGHIAAKGTHKQLLKENQTYQMLTRTQLMAGGDGK